MMSGRPSPVRGSDGVQRRPVSSGPAAAGSGITSAFRPGRRRRTHPPGDIGEPGGERLLEPERRVEPRQVAREAVGRGADGVRRDRAGRCPVGAARVGGQQRLEIAVGDEGVDLVRVATGECAGHRAGSSRSRATLRNARWMRTRTAPSDRPRTPAISAVDISSTKRRTIARRRSSGRRDTARQAAAASSLRAASPSRSTAAATVAAASRTVSGSSLGPAASLGDRVAGDLEEPDPERGGSLAVGRARALLEASEVRQRGEERPLGDVLRLVVIAQLVERVVVHLGQVLPIEGLEPGRVRLRRLDERAVAVEMDEARTFLLRTVHLPECRSGHGVTPPPRRDRPAGRG